MVNRIKSSFIKWYNETYNYLCDLFFSKQKRNNELIVDQIGGIDLGEDSTIEWYNFQMCLIEEFKKGRTSNFLNFETIKKTMYFNAKYYQFKELTSSQHWPVLKEAIKEHPFGNPPPYLHYPSSSGNLIHHAYSLNILLNEIGMDCFHKISSILEFGGGYGSFCRLINNMGYNGKYTIFDLPLFNAIQNWYLKRILKKSECYFTSETNYASKESPELFIALWSLSESPISLRQKFEPIIKQSQFVLIAFQQSFSEINNYEYFSDYITKGIVKNGKIIQIKAIPNNYYLVSSNDHC